MYAFGCDAIQIVRHMLEERSVANLSVNLITYELVQLAIHIYFMLFRGIPSSNNRIDGQLYLYFCNPHPKKKNHFSDSIMFKYECYLHSVFMDV